MKVEKVILIFALVLHVGFKTTAESEKSLFDDLPLNGAYIEDLGSTEQLSGSDSEQNDSSKHASTVNAKLTPKSVEASNSLFDSMPQQGALAVTTDTIFESKTQKRGIFNSHQPGFLQSPNGELRFQIELERPDPAHQFRFSNLNSNQQIVPGQVQPLVPIVPVVHPNGLTPVATHQYAAPSRAILNPQNSRNSEHTSIIYGNHVQTLRTPNNLNQLHQEPRKEYSPPNRHRSTGYTHQKLPFPIITGPSTPSSIRGYGQGSGNGNIDITTSAPTPPPPTSKPIIVSSTSAPLPSTSTARPPSSSGTDYDYETLEDFKKQERFRSRTGIFKYNEPSESYNVPSEEARSYYDDRRPSDSYGPPAPPPSYGPPPPPLRPNTPSPTYGPPPRAPAAEPLPPPRPSSTTSISYQTIPIQTVQTQLVTVPQITVSASSVSEGETNGNSRPQSPPKEQESSGYGNSESPARGGLSSGGIFTDEQIALLLSASRGARGSLYENDDPLALFLGANRNTGSLFSGTSNFENLGFPQISNGGSNRFASNQVLLNSPISLPLNQFGSNLQSGLSQDQIRSAILAQQFQDQRIRNSDFLFSGTRNGPVLTGDAVNAVEDILREQRLRNAVAELRGRLRQEGQRSVRERQNYRSLLYRGALLLGALTLLPTVATPLAAAATGIQTPHFLLPLVGGRRKRSAEFPVQQDELAILLEFCKNERKLHQTTNNSVFTEYLNCIGNSTMEMSKEASLFDALPFHGALVPETIRSDLKKYIPVQEIINHSGCVQREGCKTIVEIQKLPESNALNLLASAFVSEIEGNTWIRETLVAAQKNSCAFFHC